MFTQYPQEYLIPPGAQPDLESTPTKQGESSNKGDAKRETRDLQERIKALHEKLYAGKKHSVLIVLQALDAAGKDSTIRRCFGPLNPHWCETTTFREPNQTELLHDFLWRIHEHVPKHGMIGIFNRSHYEDVIAARVKNIIDRGTVIKRYEHINAFEKLLTDEGVVILKFYLHISNEYQKRRLQRRLRREDKRWKFNLSDLKERKKWDDYMVAYRETLGACSTQSAPWYVIPAERRWYRDLVILRILHSVLDDLNLHLPEIDFDPDTVKVV